MLTDIQVRGFVVGQSGRLGLIGAKPAELHHQREEAYTVERMSPVCICVGLNPVLAWSLQCK